MMEAVRSIRNARAELNVPPSKKAAVIIRTEKADVVKATEEYFKKLASAESVTIIAPSAPEPENASSNVVALGEVFLPLGQLVDKEKELERLSKERKHLEGEIARAKGKLSNEKFTSKAPEKVVAEERQKLAKYQDMLEKVLARIAATEKL